MGTGQIVVRPAAGDDYPGISDVFGEENRFHVDLLPEYIAEAVPPIRLAEFNEFLENRERALLVATVDDRLVGVTLAALKDSADMPFIVKRRFVYVMDLVVSEKYRRRGVGRALLTAVTGWATEHGVRDIELNVWERNEEAVEFYRRVGFETLDRRMTKRL